jgi:hypothetical protein
MDIVPVIFAVVLVTEVPFRRNMYRYTNNFISM